MAAHKQPTCIYDVSHSLESTLTGQLGSTRLPDKGNKRGRVSWEKPQRRGKVEKQKIRAGGRMDRWRPGFQLSGRVGGRKGGFAKGSTLG